MSWKSAIAAVALVLACCTTRASAQIIDLGKYPDLTGQWRRYVVTGLPGQGGHDQTKPWGFGQEAPLTDEYIAIFKESLADQARGGLGLISTARCLPAGMPHMMMGFGQMEFVIAPGTTHILIDWDDHGRRIFTDGRDWPPHAEAETRGPFKGPRSYDPSGLPLHFDNQSVFKERFFIDKDNPNIMHDVMTTIDHALTRPWTVDKRYRRTGGSRANWSEYYCGENNAQVVIGKENYFLANGFLMPVRKGQVPPDLRYFEQPSRR